MVVLWELLGHSLTVVGTEVKNNQANHTGAGDSGFAGGIGVGYGGSLVADSCIVVGNRNTGDTTDNKGLAGGIGAWQEKPMQV